MLTVIIKGLNLTKFNKLTVDRLRSNANDLQSFANVILFGLGVFNLQTKIQVIMKII